MLENANETIDLATEDLKENRFRVKEILSYY